MKIDAKSGKHLDFLIINANYWISKCKRQHIHLVIYFVVIDNWDIQILTIDRGAYFELFIVNELVSMNFLLLINFLSNTTSMEGHFIRPAPKI